MSWKDLKVDLQKVFRNIGQLRATAREVGAERLAKTNLALALEDALAGFKPIPKQASPGSRTAWETRADEEEQQDLLHGFRGDPGVGD